MQKFFEGKMNKWKAVPKFVWVKNNNYWNINRYSSKTELGSPDTIRYKFLIHANSKQYEKKPIHSFKFPSYHFVYSSVTQCALP